MKLFRKFFRNQRGSVFPIIGLCMVAMVGVVATSVDYARGSLLKTELISSLDAAALAGGTEANSSSINGTITQYFNVNMPASYLGSTVDALSIAESTDKTMVTVSSGAHLKNSMMQVVGWNMANVAAATQVTVARKGMELVLVLDNTGSMSDAAGGSQSKLQAAQQASTSLLNILYGSTNNTQPNLWVGIVPFSQAVNIGTTRTSWLDSSYDSALNFGPAISGTTCPAISGYTASYSSGPKCIYKSTTTSAIPNFGQTNWGGCVESRSNGSSTPQYDITDDVPATKPFRMYLWPDDTNNNWVSQSSSQSCTGSGSHRVCTTTTTTTFDYSNSTYLSDNLGANTLCPQPLTPMVAEKSTLISAVNTMTAQGNTHIDLGLAWAWRLLSPKWRYQTDGRTSLWGGEMGTSTYNGQALPLDYNTPLMSKVVVLMTDGDNTISNGLYSAYGYPTSNQLGNNECTTQGNCATGISQLNTRTSTICTNMKAQGIIIYTIALGTDIDSTAQTLLQNCATSPDYYFYSPTTADLQTAFTTIADSLSNLRISQ